VCRDGAGQDAPDASTPTPALCCRPRVFHDVLRRRAMLKMFPADYCGDGNNSFPDVHDVHRRRHPLLYGDSGTPGTRRRPGVPVFAVIARPRLSPPHDHGGAVDCDRGCVPRRRAGSPSAGLLEVATFAHALPMLSRTGPIDITSISVNPPPSP